MRKSVSSIDGCLRYATLVLMAALPGIYLGGLVSLVSTQDAEMLRSLFGTVTALSAAIYFRSDLKLTE